MICSTCANGLASAYDFAMKVSESDKRFVDLFDESSVSKIIECVDDAEPDAIGSQVVQFDDLADMSNMDEVDDSITVSDNDQQDYDENNYVIKTARTNRLLTSEGSGNYVAVPQYTITTQPQEVDVSDMSLLSKDRAAPVIVKTVDVAAVHIASDNLEFNDSFLCKDYENDKDSMYMCKYCPKGN